MKDPQQATISITFTQDEALVLFEWIHLLEDDGRVEEVAGARPEAIALQAFSALLEAQLVEPFSEHYLETVENARRRLLAG